MLELRSYNKTKKFISLSSLKMFSYYLQRQQQQWTLFSLIWHDLLPFYLIQQLRKPYVWLVNLKTQFVRLMGKVFTRRKKGKARVTS